MLRWNRKIVKCLFVYEMDRVDFECSDVQLRKKRKLKSFLIDETLVIQAGIEDDPCDQETCERCHETFFQQFPNAAVFFLIHLLEIQAIQVNDAAIDRRKSENQVENWISFGLVPECECQKQCE